MPSQSRALEASFEPSDKSAVPLGSEQIPALEDFDSFFEKLNNLEQVDWRSAHPANPESKSRPATKSAVTDSKGAAKPDPLAGLRAAVAQAKQSQQPGVGSPSSGPAPLKSKKPRAIAGAFRFAATAFVLFIVGMGIGWAALSLPSKLNSSSAGSAAAPSPSPEANGLVVEPKVSLPDKATRDASADRMVSIVPLTDVTAGASSTDAATTKPLPGDAKTKDAAAKPISDLAVDLAASKAANQTADMPKADSDLASAAHGDAQDAVAPGATTSPAPAPHKAPAKTKPAKTVAAAKATEAPAASTAASAAADGSTPHFAVQVGACRSARCVDTYRKLVTTHLPANADSIRVIPVTADGSGIQRIRVAPLDKAEAQQLRTVLVQADPRLGAAYVVEVRP